jgi:predicted signal transduction protein with EAL and GGDEF domain
VAERIHNFLKADEELPLLGLSIGIATFPQCGNTVPQLIEHADRALYEMKGKSKQRNAQKRPRL